MITSNLRMFFFHETGEFREPECPYSWTVPWKQNILRFDVNTEKDFHHMESLYNYFGHNHFSSQDVIKYEKAEGATDDNQG